MTIHGFLELVEGTGVATWVRESPSYFAYVFVVTCHSIGLAILAGLNALVALRLLGAGRLLPLASLPSLFPLMWGGFWLNVGSGVLLLMANATQMLELPIFYVKLAFIALGAMNLRYLQTRLFTDNAMMLSDTASQSARANALLALALWLGALICGRLTAYPGLISQILGIGS